MKLSTKIRAMRRLIWQVSYQEAEAEHREGALCYHDSEIMPLVCQSISEWSKKRYERNLQRLKLDPEEFEYVMKQIVGREAWRTPKNDNPWSDEPLASIQLSEFKHTMYPREERW
jgi:hypothetical protein